MRPAALEIAIVETAERCLLLVRGASPSAGSFCGCVSCIRFARVAHVGEVGAAHWMALTKHVVARGRN